MRYKETAILLYMAVSIIYTTLKIVKFIVQGTLEYIFY
jgi:hypothetical protein